MRSQRSCYVNKHFYYRKELREIKDSGETKILLDCSFGILSEVLLQAQQVGLMGSEHNFIIASLVSTMIHGKIILTILLNTVGYSLHL